MDNTLHSAFKEVVSKYASCIAMKWAGAEYTYAQLNEKALKVGAFLIQEALGRSERVAIILENRPEWGIFYFGIMYAGCTCVPLDRQLTVGELKNLLSDSQVKVAFVSSDLADSLSRLRPACLKKIITVGSEPFAFEKYLSCPSDFRLDYNLPQVDALSPASILYTSGTTGIPKGVVLSHRNFLANFYSISKTGFIHRQDVFISILPLYHAYSFMVTLIVPLLNAATIIYPHSLKSHQLLQTLREGEVSIFAAVPELFGLIYQNILNHIKEMPFPIRMLFYAQISISYCLKKYLGLNFSRIILNRIHSQFGKNLRFLISGGARLDKEIARGLSRLGFIILEGYGLTETAPVVTINPPLRPKIGSVGKPLPGIEIKIADTDSCGIGEVVIKGANVMEGYFKRSQETKEAIKKDWFYSGDLGYIDKDGYVYLTGRKKEIIVLSSGKNIYPEEIEAHYRKSPFIKQICVLEAGNKLQAVIYPELEYFRQKKITNIEPALKFQIENLSQELPPYKRIMGFIVATEELPLTPLKKIKRFEVEKKYKELLIARRFTWQKKEDLTEEDLNIYQLGLTAKVLDYLKQRLNLGYRPTLNQHLELDLRLDSLARVELAMGLERVLDIDSLPDYLFAQIFTVRDLILKINEFILKGDINVREKSISPVRPASWSVILSQLPSQNLLKKINLKPSIFDTIVTFLVTQLFYLLFRIVWRLKISGRDNIPVKLPYIICCNHGSYLDGFIICACVPVGLRVNLFFLGLRHYFEVPLIRYLIRLMRVIPVDPGSQLIEAMRSCAFVLRNSKALCIFPEGARSLDEKIGEFKKGIGILAQELDILLVPAAIKGASIAWPRTKRLPRPYPIRLKFGRPRKPQELKERGFELGAEDTYGAIVLALREEIKKLVEKNK
jgi:long-chain acyl-CoA synthetase